MLYKLQHWWEIQLVNVEVIATWVLGIARKECENQPLLRKLSPGSLARGDPEASPTPAHRPNQWDRPGHHRWRQWWWRPSVKGRGRRWHNRRRSFRAERRHRTRRRRPSSQKGDSASRLSEAAARGRSRHDYVWEAASIWADQALSRQTWPHVDLQWSSRVAHKNCLVVLSRRVHGGHGEYWTSFSTPRYGPPATLLQEP
jgi:hypothetical protein